MQVPEYAAPQSNSAGCRRWGTGFRVPDVQPWGALAAAAGTRPSLLMSSVRSAATPSASWSLPRRTAASSGTWTAAWWSSSRRRCGGKTAPPPAAVSSSAGVRAGSNPSRPTVGGPPPPIHSRRSAEAASGIAQGDCSVPAPSGMASDCRSGVVPANIWASHAATACAAGELASSALVTTSAIQVRSAPTGLTVSACSESVGSDRELIGITSPPICGSVTAICTGVGVHPANALSEAGHGPRASSALPARSSNARQGTSKASKDGKSPSNSLSTGGNSAVSVPTCSRGLPTPKAPCRPAARLHLRPACTVSARSVAEEGETESSSVSPSRAVAVWTGAISTATPESSAGWEGKAIRIISLCNEIPRSLAPTGTGAGASPAARCNQRRPASSVVQASSDTCPVPSENKTVRHGVSALPSPPGPAVVAVAAPISVASSAASDRQASGSANTRAW